MMSVVAQKDIKEGEEITISYVLDNFQTEKNRLREINSKIPDPADLGWIQGCRCKLCTGPEEELRASDERRLQLAALRKNLIESSDRLVAEKILDLMANEGLSPNAMGIDASLAFMTAMTRTSDFSATKKDNAAQSRGPLSTESVADMMHTLHMRCFTSGKKVTVRNLVSKPQINGRTAKIVVAYNAHTGRVGVKIDDDRDLSPSGNDVMAIRAQNLFICD